MNTITIIPAFNEERTIREVITRCKEVNTYPLVVNDGSTDNTMQIVWDARVEIICSDENRGKGEALRLAFNHLRFRGFRGFEYIVIIDADLQFNPYEIPKLVEALKDVDYVIGQRDWNQVPFRHRLGNYVWRKIFNSLYQTELEDTNCGFVAMRREVMLRLKVHSGYIVDNDMLIQVIKMGYKVKNVPVSVRYNHKRGLSGIRMVIGILIFIIVKRIGDFIPKEKIISGGDC